MYFMTACVGKSILTLGCAVLEERAKIPSGVLTTAAAFGRTTMINRLQVRIGV